MELETKEMPLWDRKDRNSQNSRDDSKGLAIKTKTKKTHKKPSFALKAISGLSPRREDVAFHPRENNCEASQLITDISSTICSSGFQRTHEGSSSRPDSPPPLGLFLPFGPWCACLHLPDAGWRPLKTFY